MQAEGAKYRYDAAVDEPRQQPMSGKAVSPAQRKAPTADQKKVRRQIQRKTAYTSEDFGQTVADTFDEGLRRRDSSPAKDWDMGPGQTMTPGPDSVSAQMSDSSVGAASAPSGASASSGASTSAASGSGGSSASAMKKGAPFAGYDDFEQCVRENSDKDDPEAYCGTIKHRVEDGKKHGSLECEACGHVGLAKSATQGACCGMCGSLCVREGTHQIYSSRSYAEDLAKVATQFETNIAHYDGRVLLNSGDQIRLPSGQTTTVRGVRRHETSRDHYYVDTDMGTSVMPYSTRVQVVPNDTRQQSMPGYGDPRSNSNRLPGDPNNQGAAIGDTFGKICPVCGGKSLNVRGGKETCSRCGYNSTTQGGGSEYSFADSPQRINVNGSATSSLSAVARRAAEVANSMEKESL